MESNKNLIQTNADKSIATVIIPRTDYGEKTNRLTKVSLKTIKLPEMLSNIAPD